MEAVGALNAEVPRNYAPHTPAPSHEPPQVHPPIQPMQLNVKESTNTSWEKQAQDTKSFLAGYCGGMSSSLPHLHGLATGRMQCPQWPFASRPNLNLASQYVGEQRLAS